MTSLSTICRICSTRSFVVGLSTMDVSIHPNCAEFGGMWTGIWFAGYDEIQAFFRTQKKSVAVSAGACPSEPEAFCTRGVWMSSLRLSGRSRMSREVHVRFSKGPGVKSSRSTQPYISQTKDGSTVLPIKTSLTGKLSDIPWGQG
jgi:hypothetical protein